MMVKRGGAVTSTLFLEKPNARTALYLGDRKTPQEVAASLGLGARFTDELTKVADSLATTGLPFYAISDAQSAEFDTRDSLSFGRNFVVDFMQLHPTVKVVDASKQVEQLRAKKSEAELAIITKAAEISAKAHEEVMRTIRPGMKESEIQAIMEATYRKLGADGPGYVDRWGWRQLDDSPLAGLVPRSQGRRSGTDGRRRVLRRLLGRRHAHAPGRRDLHAGSARGLPDRTRRAEGGRSGRSSPGSRATCRPTRRTPCSRRGWRS
ncbi:MAG: M24 family metallopeptidase [Gemmatimonadetes bacterium]|nr:M24 family metallopeptidase [Gemmatimonadota bacterium]